MTKSLLAVAMLLCACNQKPATPAVEPAPASAPVRTASITTHDMAETTPPKPQRSDAEVAHEIWQERCRLLRKRAEPWVQCLKIANVDSCAELALEPRYKQTWLNCAACDRGDKSACDVY